MTIICYFILFSLHSLYFSPYFLIPILNKFFIAYLSGSYLIVLYFIKQIISTIMNIIQCKLWFVLDTINYYNIL